MSEVKRTAPDWIIHIIDLLNVGDFISNIEAQPAIWNYGSPEYSDSVATEQAWRNVCAKLDPGFEERDLNEKKILGKLLHRRWKSLRDCYRREVQKQNSYKKGSAGIGRKRYIYFEQLRFLDSVRGSTESNADLKKEGQETSEEQVTTENENTPQPRLPPRNKGKKQKDEEANLVEVLKKKITQGSDDSFPKADPDTMFLMSLVPELQKIPDNQKLFVKTQVMNVILQAQSQNNMQMASYSQNCQLPESAASLSGQERASVPRHSKFFSRAAERRKRETGGGRDRATRLRLSK